MHNYLIIAYTFYYIGMEANYENLEGSQLYINENMICTAAKYEDRPGFKSVTLANGITMIVKPISQEK